MISRLGLLPRTMSGSMVPLHLGSVLMAMIHVATKATGMPGVSTPVSTLLSEWSCWNHVDLSG